MLLVYQVLFAIFSTWAGYAIKEILKGSRGVEGPVIGICSVIGLLQGLLSLLVFPAGSLWIDTTLYLFVGPWLLTALLVGLRVLASVVFSRLFGRGDSLDGGSLFGGFLSLGSFLGFLGVARLVPLL